MARPTKYEGEKTVEKVKEYLLQTEFPNYAGLAVFLGICKDTVIEWGKEHPKFSDSLKRLKAVQEQELVEGGVSGKNNTPFSIFLLKNNHGYKDKVETENTNKTEMVITGIDYTVPDSE